MPVDAVKCIVLYKMLDTGRAVYYGPEIIGTECKDQIFIGNIAFDDLYTVAEQPVHRIVKVVHQHIFQPVFRRIAVCAKQTVNLFISSVKQAFEHMDTEETGRACQQYIACIDRII